MRAFTAIVYVILLSVFFFSSFFLILLIPRESLATETVSLGNANDEIDLESNVSVTEESSVFNVTPEQPLKTGVLEEVHGSIGESVVSTISPERATDLLPGDELKNSIIDGGSGKKSEVSEKKAVSNNSQSESKEQLLKPTQPAEQTPDQPSVEVVEKEVEGTRPGAGAEGLGEESGPGPPRTNHTPPADTTEDIPSFSEWAKKQLQEAEKNKGENVTVSQQKPRHKNYASPDCGAKVIGNNPEAVSPSALLSSNRDEYLLNPCTASIWVTVELCEPIQPQRIELANFELFSSSPRDLSVYLSDYPGREWTLATTLTAKDERTVQSFPLPHLTQFVKFIKLELHSHYGTEHFCPLSLFRVYGTSEYEVLESVDSEGRGEAGGEEEESTGPEVSHPENLFGSAKAAVLSLVRRAAEVLVVKGRGNQSCPSDQHDSAHQYTDTCLTPSYLVVCRNCTDHFFYRVYNLVCCQQEMLRSLMASPFVSGVLQRSDLCTRIGLDPATSKSTSIQPLSPTATLHKRCKGGEYLSAVLPAETIAALCNMMAESRRGHKPGDEASVPTEPIEEAMATPALPTIQENTTVTSTPPLPDQPDTTHLVVEGSEMEASEVGTNSSRTEDGESATATSGAQPPTNPPSLPTVPPTSPTDDPLLSLTDEEEPATRHPSHQPSQPKESVFVRLANRIKVLETNMSLSSQYLEELSLRYKKQVDELQTKLSVVSEERRAAIEREIMLTSQVEALLQRVDAITLTMSDIIMERESWFSKVSGVGGEHGLIIVVEVCLFVLVLSVCKWLGATSGAVGRARPLGHEDGTLRPRRHSADETLPGPLRLRRPSEEALPHAGSTHKELMLSSNNMNKRKTSKTENRKKKKRRREGEEGWTGLGMNRVVEVGRRGEAEGAATVDQPPSPPPPAPSFIRTALWSRRQRSSFSLSKKDSISSQDTVHSVKPKKAGVFRKFVRKLF